jgi:large subunit ribosomal protein L32
MPVARQRHTKARRDRARAMLKMKPQSTVICSNCKAEIAPHAACPKCGYYKGQEVINTLKKNIAKNKSKK